MAGWRKAWLSVLGGGGGGGGSSGSLHVHLHGLLSPSSSSSSLNSYKRGSGKYGGGGGGHAMMSSKAVLACFSVALVVAFFYVSVASGPTADASFPSPTGASSSSPSSSALLSWLSSNSTSSAALPRRSLPPQPPIPPAMCGAGIADLRNTTRRTQGSADDTGLPAPAAEQTAKTRVSDLRDAGNATVSDVDRDKPVGNGTRSKQQREQTATPLPRWRRRNGENSTHDAIVGAPGEPLGSDGATTGNSTNVESSSERERNRNGTTDAPPLNSTATPEPQPQPRH